MDAMETNEYTNHVTVRRANVQNKDNINGALLAKALGDHKHVLGTETASPPPAVGVPILRIATLTLAQLEQIDITSITHQFVVYKLKVVSQRFRDDR